MIWIILFIIIVITSAYLSWRSMKGYQELPPDQVDHGLFLIRNLKAINAEFLKKLHTFALTYNFLISLEKLFKGKDSAMLIFGPTNLNESFGELELLELEDYLLPEDLSNIPQLAFEQKKVNLNESLPWIIQPKNNPKKKLTVKPEFLKKLDLDQNQKFFWQMVLSPIKSDNQTFQATIRAMVIDPDPIKKVELAKRIDSEIENLTGLSKKITDQTTSLTYKAYYQRSLIPKEISQFLLSSDEMLSLLGISQAS